MTLGKYFREVIGVWEILDQEILLPDAERTDQSRRPYSRIMLSMRRGLPN